jgi:hypothetical protein
MFRYVHFMNNMSVDLDLDLGTFPFEEAYE